MPSGFTIRTKSSTVIRFSFYAEDAPVTVAAFALELPFTRTFFHARVSGQEIWIDNAPRLNIKQENSSVFAEPGEVVIGPVSCTRNKTAGFMGIFYGEGKLLDCGNIFAKVHPEDAGLFRELGEAIWKKGEQELTFEVML